MSTAFYWDEVQTRNARLPAHVVFRALATETVLLNIETGQYYAVDSIGGRFLEVSTARRTWQPRHALSRPSTSSPSRASGRISSSSSMRCVSEACSSSRDAAAARRPGSPQRTGRRFPEAVRRLRRRPRGCRARRATWLEAIIREASSAPPVTWPSLAGGDLAAIVAVATRVARREGLIDPSR